MQIEKIGIFRIACFGHTNASFTSFTEKPFSKSSLLCCPNIEQIPLFEYLDFGFCLISEKAQIFFFFSNFSVFFGLIYHVPYISSKQLRIIIMIQDYIQAVNIFILEAETAHKDFENLNTCTLPF